MESGNLAFSSEAQMQSKQKVAFHQVEHLPS